jgi:hypothetical protein
MANLTDFSAFIADTIARNLHPPGDFLNDASARSYTCSLLMDDQAAKTMDAGLYVFSNTRLQSDNLTQYYKPGERFDAPSPQNAAQPKSYWRFFRTSWGYHEELFDLNGPLGNPAQWGSYYINQREQFAQSTYDFLDNCLWAAPDSNEMEDQNGRQMHSIRSAITIDGLVPSGFSTAWGLSSTTSAKWRNQVESYTDGDFDGTFFTKFMSMHLKLRWITPPRAADWFDSSNFNRMVILTDRAGVNVYATSNYTNNAGRMIPQTDAGSAFAGGNDATQYWSNIPIHEAPGLTALNLSDPRFYFVDRDHLHFVKHSKKWLLEDPPRVVSGEYPNMWVVHQRTYAALHCCSRDRLGMIKSSADT